MPWGTVQVEGSKKRWIQISLGSNVIGLVMFCSLFVSYLFVIIGEIDYIHTVANDHMAFKDLQQENMFEEYLQKNNGTNPLNYTPEDMDIPKDPYRYAVKAAKDKKALKTILMLLLLPFAIQVSALLTELVVAIFATIMTMTVHIENFLIELQSYIKVLILAAGSFAVEELSGESENQDRNLLIAKTNMCRDLTLGVMLSDFNNEIRADAKIINGGLFQIFVLLICHAVPLNYYIYNPNSCVPIWSILVTFATGFAFWAIVVAGCEANETMSGKSAIGSSHCFTAFDPKTSLSKVAV